jgi:predicted dehydrogenase
MNSEGRKITCAVIGVGAFGKHYVRLLGAHPRASLLAVASPSVYSRGLDVHEGVQLYTDTESIFQDPSIEAVVIATPASTHAELAIRAIKSGKHVLLEKPLATSMDEAIHIEHAVKDSKKIFMLGHQYLYNDYVAALKKELDEGRIGQVRYVHAEQLYAGPIRHDIGCFREAATHEIALIDHLLSPGKPISVIASGLDLSGGTREDFAAATVTYESGLFAHIVISSFSPIKSRRMILGADNGMALFDGRPKEDKVSFFLRPYPAAQKINQQKSLTIPNGEIITPELNAKEPLYAEIEHFLDCIETGSTPRSDISHAMRVASVLAAVSEKL